MPGPIPKDPRLRQRRNRVAGAAVLPAEGRQGPTPPLPRRAKDENPWHPATLDYWRKAWASPMATEWIEADIPGLVQLFQLIDRFNHGEHALAAEIRLQRVCYGLTPIDRRRLQWEVEKVEQAKRRQPAPPRSRRPSDPLRFLKAVK